MNTKTAEWILCIAVAGEFIGHGMFALQTKAEWISYFTAVGISADAATTLLPLIGIVDIALAIFILIKPVRIILLWMAFWGFLTALLGPIAGEPIWDFVGDWTNWGAPLALLFLRGQPRAKNEWWH